MDEFQYFRLTILGSNNCLTTDIIAHNTKIAIASEMSPVQADKIAHGIIKVPAPKIGSKSTKPIINAINSGYGILNPAKFKIYNPIKQITNEINTKVTSAFKYPPNVFTSSFK